MENPEPQTTIMVDNEEVIGRNSSGIWTLEDDRLASVEDFAEGPSVVLVRSEHVLILAAQLPPIASLARRRAALPFAIEERIAEPLDQVHVALGEEIAPGIYLAGVVRHDLMQQWVARLELAGLRHASLVPDALALPRPGPGRWAVDLAAERACVRAADGTGFAMAVHLLEQAWTAAGQPECIAYGDPLPLEMQAPASDPALEPTLEPPLEFPSEPPLEHAPVSTRQPPFDHAPDPMVDPMADPMPGPVPDFMLNPELELQTQPLASGLAERLILPALDLRQGMYAAPRRPVGALWKRIATVAALGALAHTAIAAADTMALRDIADEREAEVRFMAQNMQPAFTIGSDMAVTVADITPDGPISAPGQFLPLLTRAGSALATSQSPMTWRSVGFDSVAQTLVIEIEAADLNALRAAAAALTTSGLTVMPSASTTGQVGGTGTAIGSFAIRAQ